MNLRYIVIIAVFGIFSVEGNAQKENKVTFESLLEEMINRDKLSEYPDPDYRFIQFSSYDRRSTTINDSTWFANSDSNHFIREEVNHGRNEKVLMDSKGPGTLVRFWITGNNYGEGKLRIYLDGNSEPEIETKLIDFISRNDIGEPLSSSVSPETSYKRRGHNLYLPIPYSKSCKVTYELDSLGGENLYYCINARKYISKVDVKSFKMGMLKEYEQLIKKVNTALSSDNDKVYKSKVFSYAVGIGKEVSITESKKGNAIDQITLRVKGDNLKRALRDIIIKVHFDGRQTIWCPIGDFFGTGYQLNTSETFYSKVEQDGTMKVKWVMPFQKAYKITFENLGNEPYEIVGNIRTKPYDWTKNTMYFHASWKQYTRLATGENKARIGYGGCFDLNFVTIKGKGVYVGDAITLFNTSLGGHWKSWWGEGDEKVYLDGELFPSIIGTGTEDYYGYAWCEYAPFNHPYISQPIGGGNFKFDMTVNMRYRGLDAMPFSKSLKFDMEMWHWTKTKINYAPTTFYYLFPGGESNIEPDYEGARAKLAFDRFDILNPEPENGLLEGENMKVIGVDKNTLGFYHDDLSGGVAMLWNNGIVGESRTFEFNADRGSILSRIGIASTIKGNVYEFILNGKTILKWESIEKEELLDKIDLKETRLLRKNTLKVKLVSTKSEKNNIMMDYLLIN